MVKPLGTGRFGYWGLIIHVTLYHIDFTLKNKLCTMVMSKTLIEKDLRTYHLGKMGHGYDYMQMRPLDRKDNNITKIDLGYV